MVARSRWSVVRLLVGVLCVTAAVSCDTPLEPAVDGVDRIVVTPTTANVEAGATATLTALVLDRDGNAMRDRKVVWASENSAIATISQSGVVTGVTAGNVQVAASSGGKSANAQITVTPRPVSLVRVSPGSATIAVTGSVTLQAEALDASGAPVIGRAVTWSSSNESVAIVSGSGVVAGISAGTVTITATIDGRSGTATINVAPAPVATIAITPNADTTIVGRRVTFRATPLDAQNLPLTGRTVVWTSSDPAIATVTSAGEVLGLAVGTARIRASVEGKFAEATIVVEPVPVARVVTNPTQISLNPGQTSQLTVTLTDSAGNILTGRSITYSSSDEAVATVSNTGLITAISEGPATIQAASEGKTATVVVTVNPVPVASITITPSTTSLGIGATTRLVAQAFDAAGKQLQNRKFTWISGAPTVVTVNQNGDVTAVAGGTAVIFAATEGISASATVNVTAGVATISVTPANPTLSVGQTLTMTAIFRDVNGTILTGRVASWSSANPSVATVNPSTGLVTAIAPGSATIVASSEGRSGTTAVTVANLPVASVTITPTAQNMFPGDVVSFIATARDANGNVMPGRPVVWGSSNPQVAQVDAAGQVTAVAQGTATITARIDQVTGNALVSVNATPVASVTLAPASASLFVGQQSGFIATARDAGGNVLSRPITWSTTNAPQVIVNVSQSGIVTAIAPGTEGVIAMAVGAGAGGTSVGDTANVTVSLVPIASVNLTPSSVTVFAGATQSLTLALLDSVNGPISPAGRTITWTSLNPGVASIPNNNSVNNTVTGVAPGSTQIIASTAGAAGTVADTVSVTVNSSPIVSVVVAPKPNQIYVGANKGLRAIVSDVGGVVRGRNVSWVSRNPAFVTVAQVSGTPDSARFVGVALGSTYIVAEDPTGLRDSSLVTVQAVPVTSVVVTPASATVNLGDTQQFSAVARDSAGGALSRTIVWSSSNPAVATVDPGTGLVTAVSAGNATITAQATGAGVGGINVSGTATVTAHNAVNTVTLSSPRSFVVPGDTVHLGVVLHDVNNNVITGRPITFQSSDANIASVDPATGIVTGVGAGPVNITATSEGKTGSVSLSGLSAIQSITIAGATAGDTIISNPTPTKSLTITVTGGGNYTLAVASSNTGVATVSVPTVTTGSSASITVTAVAPGTVTITVSGARQGAIPPGAPGNNTATASIRLTVQ